MADEGVKDEATKGDAPVAGEGTAAPAAGDAKKEESAKSAEIEEPAKTAESAQSAESAESADRPSSAASDAEEAVVVEKVSPADPARAAAEAALSEAPGVHLIVHGRTDVGLVREHNEDSFIIVRLDDDVRDPAALRAHQVGERGTLLVVCDGMGGAAAGEVASSMAVASLADTMLSDRTAAPPPGVADDARTALARKLRSAAEEANLQIFREARANLSRSGMGTTMTAVLVHDSDALIAQVGDSRCYVWRNNRFTQVTRDQSLVNQLLETGHITPEQAKFFEHSNVILQALGVQEDIDVQLSRVELRRGDRILICSDGLVGVVTDEEIAAVLGACDDPEEAARILIELANGAGGPDNITCIVARVEGAGVAPPAEGDLLEYKLWRIDPVVEDRGDMVTAPVERLDGELDPDYRPNDDDYGAVTEAPPPVEPRRSAMAELVSIAVVLGVLLGSVVTGVAMYRGAVACEVSARLPGLAVLSDGRDTGVRSAEGAVVLRLKPGRHTVALRGAGIAEASREVEVARGAECRVDFVTAPPVPEPEAAAVPAPAPAGTTASAAMGAAAAAPGAASPAAAPAPSPSPSPGSLVPAEGSAPAAVTTAKAEPNGPRVVPRNDAERAAAAEDVPTGTSVDVKGDVDVAPKAP